MGDIVVVIGGGDAAPVSQPDADIWLRAQAAPCRLCGIGAGVDMLARSLGLDAGASGPGPQIARRVDAARMCRGKTAALDLMLALVAEDLGRAHALRVAEALLMYVWRGLDEPLPSAAFALQKRSQARFAALHDHIRLNLKEDLRVERLADLCRMTPRTFARLYFQETGLTPAAAVAGIRLEAARTLVGGPGMSLAQISYLTGFGSELSLRRAFVRAFGKLPTEMRDQS